MAASSPEGSPAPAADRGEDELERIRREVLAEHPVPGPGDLPPPADQGISMPHEEQLYPAGRARDPLPPELSQEFLRSPSMDLHLWHGVWALDVPVAISSHRALGALVVGLKRLLRRFVRAPIADLFDRQRVYNGVLIHNVVALQETVRLLSEKTIPGLLMRNDALLSVQDQRSEALEARLADADRRAARIEERLGKDVAGQLEALHRHAEAIRGEVLMADRETRDLLQDGHERLRQALGRLQGALDAARSGMDASRRPPAPEPAALAPATESLSPGDDAYVDFENAHRGPEAVILEKQRFYLPYFKGASRPVLDGGAGRGEFLELCRAEGIPAYGVDGNGAMVRHCRDKGLDAREGDLVAHLAGLPDGSLGGIFMAQVVEHLPRAVLARVARLCLAKLAPGGRLAIESVNPLSPIALSRNFYLDLTHERPVHPEGLRFLLEATGFGEVELAFLSPFPAEIQIPKLRLEDHAEPAARRLAEELNARVARLNEVLFGHQDFAVVATR